MPSLPQYEPGRYWGQVTGQALTTSKNGNPQFVLRFRIMGAIDPSAPEGDLITCANFERSIFWTITDKTIEFFTRDLKKLGFDKLSYAALNPETTNYHDFTNQEIEVACKHETYQGNVVERWSLYGQFEVVPLEDKEVRKLDAMFGKHLKANGTTATTKRQAKPANEPNDLMQEAARTKAESADDIPF